MNDTDRLFIEKLLKDNPGLHKTFDTYKQQFIVYAYNNHGIDNDDAGDIFHESFNILYTNIRDGKFKESGASLRTYLFGIGKNLIFKYQTQKGKVEMHQETLVQEWIEQCFEDETWKQAQEAAYRLIHEADENCNKLLKWYFWEKKKLSEIATLMGYGSEQVVKNRKKVCLDKMKIVLRRRLEDLGIHFK